MISAFGVGDGGGGAVVGPGGLVQLPVGLEVGIGGVVLAGVEGVELGLTRRRRLLCR